MSDVVAVDRVFDSSIERYDQEKFKSTLSLDPQYVHRHEEMRERINAPLEKRITWIRDSEDGKFSFHSVDSANIIKSVSEAYRQHQSLLQQNIQKENESACNKILLSCGVVFLVGVGTACSMRGMPGAIALIGNAILMGVTAYYCHDKASKASDAEKQAKLWSERPGLAQDVAKRRKEAYDKGFPYVYTKNLKNDGILHPLEIKGLYGEYLAAFCKKLDGSEELSNQEKLKWMGSFASMNPLSFSLMKYGLGDIPDDLQALSQKFEKFNSSLVFIKDSYEATKRGIQGETSSRIQAYEAERLGQLDRSLSALHAEVAKSKAKQDVAVNLHHPQPCSECNVAYTAYQNAQKFHEDDYAKRTDALNTHLDNRVKKVRSLGRAELKWLSDEEIQQIERETTAFIQAYKEDKARKLRGLYPIIVQTVNTEYANKAQAVHESEKQSFKGLCYEAILEIEKETDALIQSYEKEKEKTLNQLLESKQVAIANAEIQRDQLFSLYPDETSPEHKKGEQNFQREKSRQEEIYTFKVASINGEFDTKIQTARDSEKEHLKGLSRADILQIKQNSIALLHSYKEEKGQVLEKRYQQAIAAINSECESKTSQAYEVEKNRLKGLTRADILEIKQRTIVQIQAIEEERAQGLRPYHDKLAQAIAKAKVSYDAVVKTHPHQDNCHECKELEKTHQHEKKQHEAIYKEQVAAINLHFNTQIQEARAASAERLNRVSIEEAHELVKYYPAARNIFFEAKQLRGRSFS